ncbi:MAG: hypothetical protein ACKO8S_05785 [Actinomycetota bacterium]
MTSTILSSLPAIGAVKAGATCPRAGKVAVKSGNEFRCVKKGKKLVWVKSSKGVAAPAPSASPTPSLSPSPSPTPTPSSPESVAPTPMATPTVTQSAKPLTFAETLWSRGENGVFPIEKQVFEIPSEIPTSWQDVYEKRLGIPYQAWLAISKNIAANASKLGRVELLVGPNTIPNYADIKRPMELVSRALPSARNVSN